MKRWTRQISTLVLCAAATLGATASWVGAQAEMTDVPADSVMADVADSLATAGDDSLVADDGSGFQLFTKGSPSLSASWTADVTSTNVSGNATATTVWWDGVTTTSKLGRSSTSFRQQDRQQVRTDFNSSLVHSLDDHAKLSVNFVARRNRDENKLTNGDSNVLSQDNDQTGMQLAGGTEVVEGIQQRWVATGRYESSRQQNRGTRNNRSLLKGGLSSLWIKADPDWILKGRFGLHGESGTRQLLSFDAAASARTDTLGMELDVDPTSSRWTLNLVAERVHFEEARLELARNSSGLIDTTGIAAAQQVGQERESRASQRLGLDLDARPWGAIGVTGRAGHEFAETQFVFSPQGILQTGQTELEGSVTFRYAESGSLSTNMAFSDRYNDRRTRDSEVFRGRESRQTTELHVDWDQHLFAATDLGVIYRETLTQTINEAATNKNDRDLLVSRVDVKVDSKAMSKLDLSAGATYSTTDDINIDAQRVGNNKRNTLIEVRGGYTYNPNGELQLLQSYRLQIVYIDLFESDDRDQYNKQAQLRNEVSYTFATGPSFRFEYLVDFRRNGTRDVSNLYRETYLRTLRRFDHQFTARVGIPWRGLNLDVWTKRGYLREQRGSTNNDEDRGEFHVRLGGKHAFFEKKATVSLDLERILQFGPRVRQEAEDYWKANTSITVVF